MGRSFGQGKLGSNHLVGKLQNCFKNKPNSAWDFLAINFFLSSFSQQLFWSWQICRSAYLVSHRDFLCLCALPFSIFCIKVVREKTIVPWNCLHASQAHMHVSSTLTHADRVSLVFFSEMRAQSCRESVEHDFRVIWYGTNYMIWDELCSRWDGETDRPLVLERASASCRKNLSQCLSLEICLWENQTKGIKQKCHVPGIMGLTVSFLAVLKMWTTRSVVICQLFFLYSFSQFFFGYAEDEALKYC